MQFSYLAIFLFFIILLAVLLIAPFRLSLNIGKEGALIAGSIKLAWLGATLMKMEIPPQSAAEEIRSNKDRRAGNENEDGKKKGKNERKISADNEKTGITRPPSIQSMINAAPALANIMLDLLKSILFKKFSCSLCFGLDDPSQTAIISGYLWSAASVLGLFPGRIFIDPCFEGERLEGELAVEIEARLLWAAFAVIQALRVREIRLLLREMMGWA
ncbi:MAG: DUF2953 domain-containing protein [Methanothrix sp.]|nr:DUF2953 domain-containing protein [Methanothrix sp.]